MRKFYNKQGYVISSAHLIQFLQKVTELSRFGFRKGFALAFAAEAFGVTVETSKEIWNHRTVWLKKVK